MMRRITALPEHMVAIPVDDDETMKKKVPL